VGYPAADPSAVAVGSVWTDNFGGVAWGNGAIDYTTAADRIVSHSNRSATLLDILAPGAIITSCNDDWEGAGADWVTMSGTSMATPAVAGLAALLRQAYEENYDTSHWSGNVWFNTILGTMQESGVSVHDGDDEDDNVANLNVDFARIDVLAALDLAVPEPACGALLVAGWLVLLRRRGARGKKGTGYFFAAKK
jgi:subtilisin family serine protease